MTVLYLLLYIAAFVCFVLAFFGPASPKVDRFNLTALGLAAWVAVPLLMQIQRLD